MCGPVTALASGVARGPGRRAERACCAFLIVSIMFMLPPPSSLPPPPKSILGATDRDACDRCRGTATNAWLVAKTATSAIVVSLATMSRARARRDEEALAADKIAKIENRKISGAKSASTSETSDRGGRRVRSSAPSSCWGSPPLSRARTS